MGCFASRLDRRNVASNDFNTVQTAFLGGKAGELFDNFPSDRVLAFVAGDKEPSDFIKVEEGLKLAEEAVATEYFKESIKFLKAH